VTTTVTKVLQLSVTSKWVIGLISINHVKGCLACFIACEVEIVISCDVELCLMLTEAS